MTFRWLPAHLRRPLMNQSAFSPAQLSAVKRWYRLAASTPNAGEYDSITEVLGGTSITQTDADRKPEAATSTNALPVATYDGTDVMLQALESGNNDTSKWWLFVWIKPADFGATQAIHYITGGVLGGSASANRSSLALLTTSKLSFSIFSSGNNGRTYQTAGTLTAATWANCYIQYDNSKTAECDTDGATADAKLRIAIGGTFQALTAADVGTGGVPTQLAAVTGSAVLGGANNSDTPVSPLRNGGQLGPNLLQGDTPLTAAELARLVLFEAPT